MHLLLFDIDGTILRFKKGLSRKIFGNLIKRTLGKSLEENHLPDFAGMTDMQIFLEIAHALGIPEKQLRDNFENIWKIMLEEFDGYMNREHIVLMPGIDDLVKNLNDSPNIQLGLLTGNYKEIAYRKLRVFGMAELFPIGAFGSDHENRNMLPNIAIKRANDHAESKVFDNSNTLIIGDTPRDIECAKSNQIKSLAVATGLFSYDELAAHEPDSTLNDFSDLQKTIAIIMELINEENNNSN